jgi:ACS family hexuronate transporter-like MFS transporter
MGPPPGPSIDRGRWGLLAFVTGAHMLGAVSVLAVAPLAPLLLEDLHLTRAQVGLFLPAIYLGGVLMSLPAGWFTDRFGARFTLAAGQGLTGVLVALAAEANRLALMLFCLFVGGLGWAVVNPATGRAILQRFPARERGFAMGIKQTGLTLGGIAGSLTLPAVGLAYGWRAAMMAAACASLVAAVAGLAFMPSDRTFGGGGATEPARFGELGRFLGNRSLLVLLVSGLALGMAQASVLAYLALFARERLGLSVIAAGGLLALVQAGGTGSRLAWGIISDRVFGGRRRPCVIINSVIGGATYLVFAAAVTLPLPVIGAIAFVAGAGAFGWVGLFLALAAEVGGPRYAGLLTGVAVSFAWSGVLLGPPLFGALLQATGSYGVPWLVLSLLAFGAAIALAAIPPLVKRE